VGLPDESAHRSEAPWKDVFEADLEVRATVLCSPSSACEKGGHSGGASDAQKQQRDAECLGASSAARAGRRWPAHHGSFGCCSCQPQGEKQESRRSATAR